LEVSRLSSEELSTDIAKNVTQKALKFFAGRMENLVALSMEDINYSRFLQTLQPTK
jgi:hypothetical protein